MIPAHIDIDLQYVLAGVLGLSTHPPPPWPPPQAIRDTHRPHPVSYVRRTSRAVWWVSPPTPMAAG